MKLHSKLQCGLRAAKSSAGFTMIEVMVAFFILALGLVGMALMQAQSLKFNAGSYSRSQASVLAYDIIERMRMDPGTAPSYTAAPSTGTCDPAVATVDNDLICWHDQLANRLSQGTGQIIQTAATQYTVRILWQERFTRAGNNADWENDANVKPIEKSQAWNFVL
ncbi:MAG: type IV pilus modification protein PilV [Gammaproteobacteria bacterium]|nr:type IV pilus modification protein PilV [Gammaproteobacteria bacterium]